MPLSVVWDFGFYLGTNPILMAMVFFCPFRFRGVEWASKTQDVREDSAIAGVWALEWRSE